MIPGTKIPGPGNFWHSNFSGSQSNFSSGYQYKKIHWIDTENA